MYPAMNIQHFGSTCPSVMQWSLDTKWARQIWNDGTRNEVCEEVHKIHSVWPHRDQDVLKELQTELCSTIVIIEGYILCLVPRLRISGVVCLLPHQSSCCEQGKLPSLQHVSEWRIDLESCTLLWNNWQGKELRTSIKEAWNGLQGLSP